MQKVECRVQNRPGCAVGASGPIILHSTLPTLHLRAGGLPRICTAFSPGKSRDFTVKVCNPRATRIGLASRSLGRDQSPAFAFTGYGVAALASRYSAKAGVRVAENGRA